MKLQLPTFAFLLTLFLLAPIGRTATWIVDPGLGDTVRIDSVISRNTGTAIVPIYFFNDEPLGGLEVTVSIQSVNITVDSFSWIGGRGNGAGTIRDIEIFAAHSVTIVTVPLTDPLIPVGSGLLGKLYVHYPIDTPEETALIDTTTIVNELIVYQTSFSDGSSNRFIPQFRRGAIAIRQGCCTNRRGNANGDANDAVNIVDVTFLVWYLFREGPAPVCREEANVNGDVNESVNIVDVTSLVAYLFRGGALPPLCP